MFLYVAVLSIKSWIFNIVTFKPWSQSRQEGATLLEYIIYTVLALGVLGGVAVFAANASSNAAAISLTKSLAATQISTKKFYNGVYFGTDNLNAALIAGGIIPSDWSVSGTTLNSQSGTNVIFTGVSNTFTTSIIGMSRAVCQKVLASSSISQWSSVTVNGTTAGTAIKTWPISQSVASSASACGAAQTTGLTATFTSN
jgi:hypothetical protein